MGNASILRFGLVQAGRYAAGLVGALLLVALVEAAGGSGGFLHEVAARIGALVHFDFGISDMTGARAAAEVGKGLPATFALLGGGAVVALVLGVPLGLLLSWGRALRAGAPLIQLVAAAPVFCAGLALLWIAHRFNWDVRAQTAQGIWTGDPHSLFAFGLPVLVVGAAGAAAVQLAIRRAAKAAANAPYREGLALMGLGRFEIDRRYVAPRLVAGLFASLGEIALSLFAATAVAEWVFAWPGAATLFIHSAALGDWNVAALVLFVFAGLALTADFLGMLIAHLLGDA